MLTYIKVKMGRRRLRSEGWYGLRQRWEIMPSTRPERETSGVDCTVRMSDWRKAARSGVPTMKSHVSVSDIVMKRICCRWRH